jgi:glycosyltransferase involved in cell wall biosynthesis
MSLPAAHRPHRSGAGLAPDTPDVLGQPDRTRVVHLITGLTLGGAERHVESLLRGSRYDTHVLAVYRDGPVGEQLRAQGHRARSLDLQGIPRPTAILRVAAELRRLRPDVVHVHLLSAQGIGIPAARLARVPVVVSTEHSIMDNEVEGRPTTRRLKFVYRCWERFATHTVAVSPTTARRLHEWGVPERRTSVVELGIDFTRLRFDRQARTAVRAELGVGAGADVVGAVGRLDPVKRFPVLVNALSGWLGEGDRHLVIVGAGPQHALLEDLAARAGVSDRVHVVGPRPDVIRWLSAFDVLASPSRDETFGIAVVEAIGNGLPVVYAQCPAVEDLGLSAPRWFRLPDGSGPDGPDSAQEEAAVRSGVVQALAAGRDQDSSQVPAELIAHYDVRRRVGEIDDLYARLLGARRGRQAGERTSC